LTDNQLIISQSIKQPIKTHL